VANAPFYFIHEKVKGDVAYGAKKLNILSQGLENIK
jgi:hypothetical protein